MNPYRSPEKNGKVERLHRTIEEECLWKVDKQPLEYGNYYLNRYLAYNTCRRHGGYGMDKRTPRGQIEKWIIENSIIRPFYQDVNETMILYILIAETLTLIEIIPVYIFFVSLIIGFYCKIRIMTNETEMAFARRGVGIYRPNDLDDTLREIALANGSSDWIPTGKDLDRIAYYLGYAMHWKMQGDIATDSTPFQDFEKLHLPNNLLVRPLDILRFGCAGETSLTIELSRYQQAGITIKSHTTVDLSLIPLTRIQMTESLPTYPVLSNAIRLPVPDESFDLMVTDQLLGSSPREHELSLLEEIHRVGRSESQVIMKVFAGLGTEGLPTDVGLKWREDAIERFGQTGDRDNYAGLTEEQWRHLGLRYAKFVNAAYFNTETQFSSFGEIVSLVSQAGFRLEESVPYGTDKEVDSESIGDFIIRIVRL